MTGLLWNLSTPVTLGFALFQTTVLFFSFSFAVLSRVMSLHASSTPNEIVLTGLENHQQWKTFTNNQLGNTCTLSIPLVMGTTTELGTDPSKQSNPQLDQRPGAIPPWVDKRLGSGTYHSKVCLLRI